jgi:RNA polymerase-binding transcription factor DksA
MLTAESALLAQRDFRIHQLQELEASCSAPVAADPAHTDVRHALQAAALAALRDIDAALRRIDLGIYGRCVRCGRTLSAHRVRVLPMTPLCGRCHRATAGRVDDGAGTAPAGGEPLRGGP